MSNEKFSHSLVNDRKNFVLMMINVKDNNDDAYKVLEGRDLKHRYEMFKIISKYDEVFQKLEGLPPKRGIQHGIQLQKYVPLPNIGMY